jgi:two-component system, NarL family, nitrate/nitrite response regulator NarL
MPTIKIVIADAQFLIRLGLVCLLSKDERFKVVGEAENSKALLQVIQKTKPEVLIIDYNQLKSFDLEDLLAVKKLSPKTHALIISDDEDRDNIYKAIDSGGVSFLTKECDQDEIVNAVLATAKGEKFICHKIIDIILNNKDPHAGTDDCKPFSLSLREVEIIQLTAKGLAAKEIATKLFLSPHTVYTHKKNIMKKLKLNSSSEMILYAINNGLTAEV